MKVSTLALAATLFAFPALSQAGRDIRPCDLPRCAREAVCRVAPGIRIQEVEVKTRRGVYVYEVEGECARYEYEIKVTGSGHILDVDRDD